MGSAAEKIDDKPVPQIESVDVVVDESQSAKEVDGASVVAPESIIRNYLRLMTWEELVEIASVFDSSSMIPLTQYLTKEILQNRNSKDPENADQKDDQGKSAKIIPFRKDEQVVENFEQDDEYQFDKYDNEAIDPKEKNVIAVNKNGSFSIYDHEEELQRKKQELKKVNIGEFILRQKNKLKQCQKKLKKKEIYLLYKNNSSVDIRSSKNENEKDNGMKIASNSGLLIDKRQK